MAKFACILAAFVIVLLAVEISCWPNACSPQLEIHRDIDDKRQVRRYCRCGNSLYNPGTHLCCIEQLYPKHRGHLCCGERTYNCYTQLCCDGVVKAKTRQSGCCGRNICTGTWNDVCCSSTSQCCGRRPYNPTWQTCCKGKVLSTWGISSPACCGTTVYDSKEKMCCSGHVSPKPMGVPKPKCICGMNKYNPATEECCYGAYVRDIGCCNPGSVPWYVECRI